MLDFYFHYLHITRYILQQKVCFFNSFSLPYLAKLLLFFSVINSNTLEDTAVYNYFYLFRFFFGRKAYVTHYRSFYSLRTTYYSFDICLTMRCSAAFFPVAIYVNDLHRFLNIKGYSNSFINFFCYSIVVMDTNLFTEKKTNLGLYNIKHSLNYRFYIANSDTISTKLFLDTFKLHIFQHHA